MTAGSISVFSNGDQKIAANEDAISSLLRRVYRAMTEEIAPARNVEEELSRVFFPRVGAQQPPLCNPRVNYGSNGRSGKKGRLRSSSWKVKSAKESTYSISLLFIDYGIAASSIRLTNSDRSYHVQT